MTTSTRCEFCDKRGLPLLLVRDAIAPAGAGAPLAPSLPIELAPTAAHYTKRLLRSGYVNVYDEARRRWEAYFVTADGYFFRLLQTEGISPVIPLKPFNCPDEGHRALASCITIPDPKNATTVWIGYSDVLWTQSVRKANENAEYRKRHMTKVDVKTALTRVRNHHSPISQLGAIVAEYAMPPSQAKAALSWSPFALNVRYEHTERLKQEFDNIRSGAGLIITLPDPAGLAQELAFLMKRNTDLFVEGNEGNKRNLAASLAIAQIEEAIKLQAENNEIAASEDLANQQVAENPLGHWLSESTRKKTADISDVKAVQLNRAADEAWQKYAEKFDDQARQSWSAAFNTKLKGFDAKYIAPLALNHVAWMRSLPLASYFECNYDVAHPESGAVYAMVVTQCIYSTQDKQACSALYEEWLKGDIADTKNILLRAMLMNQAVAVDAVKRAAGVSVDWRQIPWDNIFAAYGKAVERLSANSQDTPAQLIVQIAGPLARVFDKVMDGTAGFRAAVMATGLISGHPVVVCDIAGTKRQFRTYLIRQLLRSSGQVIPENAMRRAVAAELKRQQIHGLSLDDTTRKRWVMIADKEIIARMPGGLKPQARADWLARSLKTVDTLEELNLNRWRTVINKNLRSGILTGILQGVSLTKLFADEEKSLAHDKTQAITRRYAGMVAIAASTSETIGSALLRGTAPRLYFAQGMRLNTGSILLTGGRTAGLITGLFLAWLDLKTGMAEHEEGAHGLVVASYYGSALLGAGLSLALISTAVLGAAAIPVIGILLVLLIGIGILIEHIKDNPIQDWLERCPWGKLRAQRYADFATEQAQLKAALK